MLTLLSSGCVSYTLTFQFDHQSHGYIRQHVELAPAAAALTAPALTTWLETSQTQVESLGGWVDQLGPYGFDLVLPVGGAEDFIQAYRQLFQTGPGGTWEIPGLTLVPSTLELTQINRVVAVHNTLKLGIDLQNLDRFQSTLSAQAPLELGLQIQTPDPKAERLSWQLVPGQLNYIEVDFWLPSLVGIGGLGIGLLVLLGYIVRYGK